MSAIALEATVIFRGLRAALQKRYPLFYAYVGCVFLIELLRVFCYKASPNFYPAFYWHTELVTIAASYAVILEIFRQALRHNPGVARVAQKLLLVVFVIAFTYSASDLLHGGFVSIARATADLGRYLLYVKGVLLVVMLWLFGRYRISFGRNLLGLTAGYSLVVGLDVMNLALLSLPGHESSIGLRKLLPITYLITLIIWSASLWSVQPDPVQLEENAIDRDYGLLVDKTMTAFAHLSEHGRRTFRP
ncbi:MAG TPA: hypothetical protein VFI45_03315 [Candidatus Acidoferrum sp.]|nr:hypothetical protein [Candidatus Acidoferrum sp.]